MRDDHLVGEGRLFEPDVMLPAQYFTVLRKRSPQGPEYLLVIAMLQDAIECFQKYRFATDENGRELFADAYEWITSDDRKWPFSFENVCGILKLELRLPARAASSAGARHRMRARRQAPRCVPRSKSRTAPSVERASTAPVAATRAS